VTAVAPPPTPPELKNLEDVIHYIYHHEGQIQAWWAQQFQLNSAQKSINEAQASRIASLERRLWLITGAAAGIGALLGTSLPRLFGG